MCCHIGPEFVEALTSRAVDKSAVDPSPELSEGTRQSEGQKHLTTFGHLISNLRAFILAGDYQVAPLHIVGVSVNLCPCKKLSVAASKRRSHATFQKIKQQAD
jgi:hypothetical protein